MVGDFRRDREQTGQWHEQRGYDIGARLRRNLKKKYSQKIRRLRHCDE